PGLAKSGGELCRWADGAHEEGYVDLRFGILARAMCEAAFGMNEVVLHIDDDQRRGLDIRAGGQGHVFLLQAPMIFTQAASWPASLSRSPKSSSDVRLAIRQASARSTKSRSTPGCGCACRNATASSFDAMRPTCQL